MDHIRRIAQENAQKYMYERARRLFSVAREHILSVIRDKIREAGLSSGVTRFKFELNKEVKDVISEYGVDSLNVTLRQFGVEYFSGEFFLLSQHQYPITQYYDDPRIVRHQMLDEAAAERQFREMYDAFDKHFLNIHFRPGFHFRYTFEDLGVMALVAGKWMELGYDVRSEKNYDPLSRQDLPGGYLEIRFKG